MAQREAKRLVQLRSWGLGGASNAKLIDAMSHEAVILTQQDARMAFSSSRFGASLAGEVHQVRQI
jgi:hypothetical protein